MDCQIKLFSWPDEGNHIITIARGLIDTDEFNEILRRIGEMALSLPECKVLVDLADAQCHFEHGDIQGFVDGLRPGTWRRSSKVALVAAQETEQKAQLKTLSDRLSNEGVNIAAFDDTKSAIQWLRHDRKPRTVRLQRGSIRRRGHKP
jgi:hypothetical protein